MTFKQILEKYRKYAFSERDKGDRFERLMEAYLQTDPKYVDRFKKVWLWNDFPGRNDLGGTDTGIDLVALTYEGDYWAIQCKCYQEGTVIDKKAVDSFLSTSSRQFKDVDNLKTVGFSHRLWIDTTGVAWGKNAEQAIRNQNPPVTRLGLFQLEEAPVQWEKLDQGISGDSARAPKFDPKPHQLEAIDKTHERFENENRGKLIMACGTGKTFTSLRIAENETKGNGLILFLVPSIALLGQTLREWTAQSLEPINAICICSDPDISKRKKQGEDADFFSTIDLALPASTDINNIVKQFDYYERFGKKGMTVVFSTYQSIDVIANAQQVLLQKNQKAVFDLIICDEAHRTTGVTLSSEDESAFVKVHNNEFIQAKKRLYMTATPRLYSDDSKAKAAKADAIIASMDEAEFYGEEIYRIGFGEAVEKDLLTDYKVLILTLNDNDVPLSIQRMIADENSEINSDDASKLIGCINALSKQLIGDDNSIKSTDPDPMKRAVAFCSRIVDSKKITNTFNDTSDIYIDSLPPEKRQLMTSIASRHIDGTMNAPQRDELLNWLKEESDECRILTNVRCLSEGVDVPSLDAVMFLSARNSQVDVVQSVGRVMRKSPNKKYGYIIIPVIVPSDIEPEVALDDNKRFAVVWTVLNALRAHDDRFNATVNKIDLNKRRPDSILIGRPDYTFDKEGNPIVAEPDPNDKGKTGFNNQLMIQFEKLQSVMFARMVKKVGDRRYWEQWATNVAEIAERQIDRIRNLIARDGAHKKAFEDFLKGLQKNINPSINEEQAVEMLSQHIITKPVFEALFEQYSFVRSNPISLSMQKMLSLLEEGAIEKDTVTLNKFYDSVRKRAAGIDNAEGKQKIIVELYDKFFKTAFPKMVEQLGIVYTPVEVVDFIIHSVNDVLKKEFDCTISDENIHILDPFTGTGTFITRLLQSGLINRYDVERKYTYEIHANEIVLLAYYIAAVNIENAYHDIIGHDKEYQLFEGICLTDTFQLGETKGDVLFSEMFPENSKRLEIQRRGPIRVIMGNPPYSIGQRSANDNAQNQSYPILDSKIANTYAKASSAGLSRSLYDPYIKAFRWSSDRLDKDNGGIICFVSNGKWISGNSFDGFRKYLEEEFSSIYVFDLRGDQRTSGEDSRREGGKIFGAGSRTKITITLLVKKPKSTRNAKIKYFDIGDYLKREEKLTLLADYKTVSSEKINWKILTPNKHGDWLRKRNDLFETFIPIAPTKKFDFKSNSFFNTYAVGIGTNRDVWVYNFSNDAIVLNMTKMINFYNNQVEAYHREYDNNKLDVRDFISKDLTKIKWTRALRKDVANNKIHQFQKDAIRCTTYRPFNKINLYYHKPFIESPGLSAKLFPNGSNVHNLVICVTGIGSSKEFSTLITDAIPDLQLVMNGQTFPLYYFEDVKRQSPNLFDGDEQNEYIRKDGVSDFIYERAKKQYGKNVTKEDIFYYVYGILHSPDYRIAFKNDLQKMLPRIPLIDEPRDFWKFNKAGRALAELHINYESAAPYPEVTVHGEETSFFTVEKMRFIKKGRKDIITYNSKIWIENIPNKAYEYIVNGKSAIEWIMERYQVKVDKKSGIKNDPNDWAKEVGNPRYILDLLLSIINVSVQTVDIVAGLPKLEFGELDTDSSSKEKLASPAYVELILTGDYESYSNEQIASLLLKLETELELESGIKLLLKEKGSVRLTLELDSVKDANLFVSAATSGILKSHGIGSASLRDFTEITKQIEPTKTSTNNEKWVGDCKEMLAKGKTEELLEKLRSDTSKPELQDKAMLLLGRWNRNRNDFADGIISLQDKRVEENQITLSVNDLVNGNH